MNGYEDVWRRSSIFLFAGSAAVFVTGILLTTVGGPCNPIGPYIVLAGIIGGGGALFAHLVWVAYAPSFYRWVVFVAVAIVTAVTSFYGFLAAILMCRGI